MDGEWEDEGDDAWGMEETWEDEGDAHNDSGFRMEVDEDYSEKRSEKKLKPDVASEAISNYKNQLFRAVSSDGHVLDEKSLLQKIDTVVQAQSEILFVSPDEADCLLRHYQWDQKKLQSAWFADSKAVRQKVGLVKATQTSAPTEVQCLTAFCDVVPVSEATSLNCGHWFCNSCWELFFQSEVNGGRKCIYSSCMGMRCQLNHNHKGTECSCNEMIPLSKARRFISDPNLLSKYQRWLVTSFVEGHSNLKFCPNPKCNHALFNSGSTGDTVCVCGYRICFSCDSDGHHPAPCDLMRKWAAKEKSDDANEIWIKARTKKCPKCQVPIEKNRACNHMTCSNCSHQFCWLCKGDWSSHGTSTGGFYVCTKYNEQVAKGKQSQEEKQLMNNTQLLQKYTYYYKRYKSMLQGIKFTESLRSKIESQMTGYELAHYAFLMEAMDILIESRRVLQFTYLLAYYIRSGTEKNLFEYQQQQLTEATETLQDIVETKPGAELLSSKSIIVNRTGALDRFRSEMVKRVEGGEFDDALLMEADIHTEVWGCSTCGMENSKTSAACVACSACHLHGEMECKICVRLQSGQAQN